MSLYDDASLVMIPSGYKDGKLYSVKPSDGAGDFTFTRGSNLAATRVDENGLIEKGRENLLVQSNQFDTTWGLTGSTLVGGQSDKDGGTDAWKLTSSNTGQSFIKQVVSSSGVATYSVYAKADTANFIVAYAVGSGDPRAFFNLSSGTVETTAFNITASIEDVGNGWYRCSVIFNKTITDVRLYIADSDNVFNSGNGSSIYIQDAQLEVGLVATDYIETGATTAQAGILEDMPRLDYSGGTCPALLLEPQRTNLCPNSEDVSNWFLTFATATPNDTISPEGVQNAAKIVTSNAVCDVKLTSIPVSPSTTYTASFYCKLTSGSGLQTRFYDNTNGANIEFYTYDSQIAVGEWKRVTRTFTTPAGCNNIQIWFLAASSSASVTAHYWGYQLEEGSYATSYIPTYGTSVTRGADSCNNLGTLGIIGQTEGTILFDAFFEDNDKVNFSLSDSTSSNHLTIDTAGTNSVFGRIVASGTTQAEINTSVGFFANGDRLKCALAYKANDFAFYINGAQIGTDTSGSVPVCDDIRFARYNGALAAYQNVNQVRLFDTRLTNSELAALTTL